MGRAVRCRHPAFSSGRRGNRYTSGYTGARRTTGFGPVMTRLTRAGLAVGLMAVSALLVTASPAQAHPVSIGADPTNWRSTITSVPSRDVLTAKLGDNALRITVVAHTTTPLVVLGYNAEPFLRLTVSGAWTNQHSSTTWTTTSPRRFPAPSLVDDSAPPQ